MERVFAIQRDVKMGDAYWKNFLPDFHRAECEKVAENPVWWQFLSGLLQRFSELGPTKWAYAGGLAYAAVTAAFLLNPREAASMQLPSATRVNYETVPAPVVRAPEATDDIDLLKALDKISGEHPGF